MLASAWAPMASSWLGGSMSEVVGEGEGEAERGRGGPFVKPP